MRYIYFILLIVSFLSIPKSIAQDISPEMKDSILNNLQNSDYFIRNSAIDKVNYYNIPEALPIVENNIKKQDLTLAFKFIHALDKYNSDSLIINAHFIFNNADTMGMDNFSFYSRPEIKVYITWLLFKHHDYSTFQAVFEYAERKKPGTFIGSANLLESIIINVPQYAETAKEELIRVAKLGNKFESGIAQMKLEKIYHDESLEIAREVFANDSLSELRKISLENILKYQPADMEELLKSRLPYDNDLSTNIAFALLQYYNNISNYKFIIDNLGVFNTELYTTIIENMLSDLTPSFPDSMGDIENKIIYLGELTDSCIKYSWIRDASFVESLKGEITKAINSIRSNDSSSTARNLFSYKNMINSEYKDSIEVENAFVSYYAWNYLVKILDIILEQLPDTSQNTILFNIKLLNSTGTLLTGGSLQYYEGAWKEAVNNGDGTFLVNTNQTQVSLRMNYEYGTQTISNVSLANGNVAVFQTVNAEVKLQDSNGSPIDTGTVQYYAGAWRLFGTTANGTAYKELLPNNYSFRMTYANASNDKQQNIGTNPTVTFQTVNAAVELLNSTGTLMDAGIVQYYAGAWRLFGTTTNGTANKELLPNNYSFRMTYANSSNDKQQNIGANPSVTFQTVNAAVELRNSTGTLMDAGTVQYYAGAWHPFGSTINGTANKELLPNNYSFRMTYAFSSNDKQQNIGTNPTVTFSTVNAAIELRNSSGTLMNVGTVQYYAGTWRPFGTTTNGTAYKELLPNNYSFRMTHEYISNDKQQNVGTSNPVVFTTTACKVTVKNTESQPLDNADIKYYAGAWRPFGVTVVGEVVKELLPANLSFRAAYNGSQKDKTQNTAANSTIEFVFP